MRQFILKSIARAGNEGLQVTDVRVFFFHVVGISNLVQMAFHYDERRQRVSRRRGWKGPEPHVSFVLRAKRWKSGFQCSMMTDHSTAAFGRLGDALLKIKST